MPSSSSPPTPASQVLPIQFTQFKKEDFTTDSGVAMLNNLLSQFQLAVNSQTGAYGKTSLPSGADLGGSTLSNLGEPTSPFDAISKSHAEANYSASALRPQLEGGGPNSLRTMRRLNDKNQQESYSTFLNRVSNTAPTCNTSDISGSVSGSNVDITVTAGYHLFMDQSVVPYAQYTATVPLPTTASITSLSRTSGIVTATGSFSFTAGESIYVSGASDSSFDGTFQILTASPTTLTWSQPNVADGTATGGTASTGSIYHFFLRNPSHSLAVAGPFGVDSQQNRLASNVDQQVLIAVASVNGSGLVTDESAAGATAPAITSNYRLLTRL